MADNLLWIALAGGEVFGVVFILLFIFWIIQLRKQNRDRLAIKQLVARVARDRTQRLDALRVLLGKNYGMSGGEKERAAVQLLNSELRLLNGFSALYLKRDATAAADFDKSFHKTLDDFQAFAAATKTLSEEEVHDEPDTEVVEVRESAPESDDFSEDIAFLKTENKRLNEELRVTMETMSRMLNEYSTMFGSDGKKEVNAVMDVVEISEEAEPLTVDESEQDAMGVEAVNNEVEKTAAEAQSPVGDAVDELLSESSDESEPESVDVSVDEVGDIGTDEPSDEVAGELLDEAAEVLVDEASGDLADELLATENQASSELLNVEPPEEVIAEEGEAEDAPTETPVDLNEEFDSLFDQEAEPETELDADLFDLASDEDADSKPKA